jgi:hypothetical protein
MQTPSLGRCEMELPYPPFEVQFSSSSRRYDLSGPLSVDPVWGTFKLGISAKKQTIRPNLASTNPLQTPLETTNPSHNRSRLAVSIHHLLYLRRNRKAESTMLSLPLIPPRPVSPACLLWIGERFHNQRRSLHRPFKAFSSFRLFRVSYNVPGREPMARTPH